MNNFLSPRIVFFYYFNALYYKKINDNSIYEQYICFVETILNNSGKSITFFNIYIYNDLKYADNETIIR